VAGPRRGIHPCALCRHRTVLTARSDGQEAADDVVPRAIGDRPAGRRTCCCQPPVVCRRTTGGRRRADERARSCCPSRQSPHDNITTPQNSFTTNYLSCRPRRLTGAARVTVTQRYAGPGGAPRRPRRPSGPDCRARWPRLNVQPPRRSSSEPRAPASMHSIAVAASDGATRPRTVMSRRTCITRRACWDTPREKSHRTVSPSVARGRSCQPSAADDRAKRWQSGSIWPRTYDGGRCPARRIPAARPFADTTSAILRDASSIISSPSSTAPRAPPASEVACA
jgi:hypothetical protein